MATFEDTWAKILKHAGQEFHTKTGLSFTYGIQGSSVVPDRTNYPIHVSDFRKAHEMMPLDGPGQINKIVRGPAYVYAILSDSRTRA